MKQLKEFINILNSTQYWLIVSLQAEDINTLNKLYQNSGELSEAVKRLYSKSSQGKFWFKISKQEQLQIHVLQVNAEKAIIGQS